MSQFNIDEIEKRTLSGLKDFQRATVERVDYLFRHNQNRVLVADEVGMGKTLIARGAIVKTARLRIEEKDDLFKVIYICSNQNIANQNIRKLDVTGKNAIGSVSDTRLSMQHLKITEQENDPQIKEGFIQLIPLTPETSFRMTTGGGSVQERALMYGMKWDNPDCIHSVDEAIKYINEFGFLPLFKNEIDGFSLEERTVPEYWWSDNPEIDPWMWRAIIARRHDIVYGKFFDKKAGFISKKWLPVFANYRRDGYDFDALYDDGKAPNKHKKIMVNFMEDNADSEIYSNELKKQAGFGKDGEKGFDGAITNLMMQTYLCNCDFKKRVNKRGIEYGWDVAVYSSIEHIYGYDYVTSCYKDNPQDSWKQIVDYMHEMYLDATDKQIRKLLK